MTAPEVNPDSDDRPAPPAAVYKFVIPDRTDVLEGATIRFTPPINTNDIFEVRQTFDMLAGPKMRAMFERETQKLDFDAALANVLKETPLAGTPPEVIKNLFAVSGGGDMKVAMLHQLRSFMDETFFPMMDSPDNINDLLQKLGSSLICLSLTERFDCPPMWAHYAANSSGFVIAFDTQNPFFQRGENAERRGLQKISYFDGRISEVLDDPYSAFISKQADWSYEREWRLYLRVDQASRVIKTDDDDIHLVDFPRSAVQRVILGTRASSDLENSLRAILCEFYPGVPLNKVRADRSTTSLIEETT